jgi:cyclophilin family peptidyl-prolyl cis-trans isomerase
MMSLVRMALIALAFAGLTACEAPTAPAPASDAVAPDADAVADAAAAVEPAEEAQPVVEPPPPPTLADGFPWPAASDYVRISTSKGDMVVALYASKAPQSVANFLQYAADGHYDRTIFHRVVKNFVIQGGGYSAQFNERPTRPPVAYEGDNGLPNYRTTIAMARGRNPNSATSQWYINLRDNNDGLDHFVNDLGPRYGYAVFGRVIEGMEVADAIGRLPTGAAGPFQKEVPLETVVVIRVDRIDPPAAAAE